MSNSSGHPGNARPHVEAIINERHTTHGNFADNARISQNLKAMLHGEDAWDGLEPHQQKPWT